MATVRGWIFHLDGSGKSIVKHILLWLGFYLAFSFIMSFYGSIRLYFIVNTITVSAFALAYYPLRHLLIPKLYLNGKKIAFALLLLLQMLLIYTIYWKTIHAIQPIAVLHEGEKPFKYFGEFLIRTLRFFSPSVLLIVWEYQHNRKQHLQRIRTLEKEKLNTEIKYLKAQINPHFLFNTLNNLYSFVLTESPKALDMITRLTGILDYVLTKSQLPYVPLSSEIETIEHYLALEKVRYGDRLHVEYNAEGITTQNISPLLILSMIENAFKHGASGDIDQPQIRINITTNQENINCLVWNTKSKYKGEINDEYKKGIGLSNIKRQLDLIYPNQHELVINDEPDFFEVLLTIKANS